MKDREYADSHQDRINLLIHLLAVPLFWLASLMALTFAAMGAWEKAVWALAALGISLGLQAIGHKRESVPPRPFNGALDFLSRIFREQFYRFPAFLLGGAWWRNLRRNRPVLPP